jgi:hypothetical protein
MRNRPDKVKVHLLGSILSPVTTADLRDIDKASIDMLPDEILLEIFDFCVCDVDDQEGWVTLVHVCQRWRAIVFAAPHRLNLRLVCTSTTPVEKMLDIWPQLPIAVQMYYSGSYIVSDGVLDVLEHRDRICEIYVDCASNDELEELMEVMEATFPALTDLHLESIEMSFLPESFLGGSAPNLLSLSLSNVAFPALPPLLLSANRLTNLCLSHIPHFGIGYISPEAMADCLSSLVRLKNLQLKFQSSRPRPDELDRTSRYPPPLSPTHTVLSALKTLVFKGKAGYLDHLFTHIYPPLLKSVDMKFSDRPTLDVPRIALFIGRTKTFESLNEAYIYFDRDFLEVVLSSREGATGDKMLKLSLKWRGSAWELWCLTQSCRPPDFESSDFCIFEGVLFPRWVSHTNNAAWMELVRLFTAIEYMYLSNGLAGFIGPALQGLTGEKVTGVLPVLRDIFVELYALGYLQEALGEFIAARRLLSGHLIDVRCWEEARGSTSQGDDDDC